MSLVDPTHVEGTRIKRDCHYEMKARPDGSLAMSMKIWMRDSGDRYCPKCNFNPHFLSDGKCPRCGAVVEAH